MEKTKDLNIPIRSRATFRSPSLSPNRSPGGGPSLTRQRSASIPVTPESLMGVRNRFLNDTGDHYTLGGSKCNNFLGVEIEKRFKLPRSAPELRVDEPSSGSITPWNDDPSEYSNSLACTILRPQPDILSRRFSDTLTVSRRHRRTSLSPHHGRSRFSRPRGNSVPHIGAIYNRDRSPSIPRDWDDDCYTLRQFSTTRKGIVINKGDLYRHRSRSNTSVASAASSLTGGASTATSHSSGQVSPVPPKRVLMLGTVGVGKTALVTQFMSSEYMNAYDASIGELV